MCSYRVTLHAKPTTRQVNTVVFDKTGTLTRGKPFLTDVVPVPSAALSRLLAASPAAIAAGEASPGLARPTTANGTTTTTEASASLSSSTATSAAVLALAAACEAYSEHPVGRAMVEAATADAAARRTADENRKEQQQQQQQQRSHQRMSTLLETGAEHGSGGGGADGIADFVSEPGRGVACQHPLGRVCVGTRSWAESNGGKRSKVVIVSGSGGGDSLDAADKIMRGDTKDNTAVV